MGLKRRVGKDGEGRGKWIEMGSELKWSGEKRRGVEERSGEEERRRS